MGTSRNINRKFFFLLFSLYLIIYNVLSLSAKKDKTEPNTDLAQKAMVVLQDITRNGTVESKAETPELWALIKSEKALQVLHVLVKHKHHTIMSRAACALASLGDDEGKEILDKVLVESFDISPDAGEIEKFKLYSQYKFRKISAAKALGKIGDEVSFRLIKTLRLQTNDGQIRDGCSIALAMLNDPGERVIFENAVSLKNTDQDLRKTAVKALGDIASPASVGVLKKSLHDPAYEVRAEAARALGKIGTFETAEDLRARITDEEISVRREIIRALGIIIAVENIPLIENALKSDDGITRLIAAGSLGKHGNAKGFSIIQEVLNDKDRDVRIQAVESLAMIDDKKVLPVLETMLNDKEDMVRIKAAGAVLKKVLGK